MDLYAIAEAIADRFDGLTVTDGTETQALAALPTSELPNQIGLGPVILVYPPTPAKLEILMSRQVVDQWDFPVRWLCDPLSYPARSRRVLRWQTAMRYRVEGNLDLDLPYVAQAVAVDSRAGVDIGEYGGETKYDLVEYIIRVSIYEINLTMSA